MLIVTAETLFTILNAFFVTVKQHTQGKQTISEKELTRTFQIYDAIEEQILMNT